MNDNLIKSINNILGSKVFKNIYNDFFKDKISNKIIKILINDLKKDFYIIFETDRILISLDKHDEDVEISGTSTSFLFYVITTKTDLFSSKIKISGDVETANSLNNLLQDSGIIRGVITELIGQKSTSTLFSILDPLKEKIHENDEDQKSALSDFLKYDIHLIPSKPEIEKYMDEVDELKTRTDKLLSKFK